VCKPPQAAITAHPFWLQVRFPYIFDIKMISIQNKARLLFVTWPIAIPTIIWKMNMPALPNQGLQLVLTNKKQIYLGTQRLPALEYTLNTVKPNNWKNPIS
jgi:hypothetical protein